MPPPSASTASSSLHRLGEADDTSLHCFVCGYDLRGLDSPRCPECGCTFDPNEPVAAIPWLHRVHLGRWPAFVQTTRMVLLHPTRLARNVYPSVQVDPHSAGSYRAICGAIAAIGLAISILMAILFANAGWRPAISFSAASVPWTMLFCYLASIPTHTTGLRWTDATIRFRWLHDFTAAPLVLAPPILISTTFFALHARWEVRDAFVYLSLASAVVLGIWLNYILLFQVRGARRGLAWVASHLLVYLWWWSLLGLFCFAMACLSAGVVSLLLYVISRT